MKGPPFTTGQGRRVHPSRGTADLLALSSPLLILLALASMAYRSPSARPQAIPALLIGCGLLVFSWWRRRRRRSMVLRVLREPGPHRP
ncbi:MAG: DUF3188 domain-containing protein [Cyanobacteriota bacterium]|nr:DUF3188 domain-containing protein [Cyanobacteriota bacterium]